MNAKRPYRTNEPKPEFLHEVKVTSGSKTYTLGKGQLVSVIRKPGLIAGRYEFIYAERSKDGTLLLTVEGPQSRLVSERRRKVIRETDLKTIHIKTGRRS